MMPLIKLVDSLRWTHRVMTSTAILLLLSGTLHTLPDVRSLLFGGYDALIADIHLWAGVVFVLFPFFVLILTRGSLLRNLRVRIFKDHKWHWRRFHLTLTLSVCFLQALVGLIIWIDVFWPLPVTLVDALFFIHHMGAWYIGLIVPLHLWMVRKSVVKIVLKLIGEESSPA